MNNLNSVLVDGNLVADPDYRETTKGTPVCNFRLGSNRYYRIDTELQEEANFFDVETWAKSAERCRDNLGKGRNVRVVGRLKQDRWTDDQGAKHSRVKIVADHVDFGPMPKKRQDSVAIEGDDSADSGADSQSASETVATVVETAARQKAKAATAKAGEMQEIPF
ncbi:MAG: single-stranded DNA-binding protein [Spirochaetales bacterium]